MIAGAASDGQRGGAHLLGGPAGFYKGFVALGLDRWADCGAVTAAGLRSELGAQRIVESRMQGTVARLINAYGKTGRVGIV